MTQIEKTYAPPRTIDLGRGATLTLRWASLSACGVVSHVELSVGGTPLETGRIRLHSPSNRAGFSLACRRRLKALAASSASSAHGTPAVPSDIDIDGCTEALDAGLVTLGIDLFGELAGTG